MRQKGLSAFETFAAALAVRDKFPDEIADKIIGKLTADLKAREGVLPPKEFVSEFVAVWEVLKSPVQCFDKKGPGAPKKEPHETLDAKRARAVDSLKSKIPTVTDGVAITLIQTMNGLMGRARKGKVSRNVVRLAMGPSVEKVLDEPLTEIEKLFPVGGDFSSSVSRGRRILAKSRNCD